MVVSIKEALSRLLQIKLLYLIVPIKPTISIQRIVETHELAMFTFIYVLPKSEIWTTQLSVTSVLIQSTLTNIYV